MKNNYKFQNIKLLQVVFFISIHAVVFAQKPTKTYERWGEKHWTADYSDYYDKIFELCDVRNSKVKKFYDEAVLTKNGKINSKGISALHIAVANSDIDAVKMLLENGTPADIKTQIYGPKFLSGMTPLMIMAWYRGMDKYNETNNNYPKNDSEIIKLLVSYGANVNLAEQEEKNKPAPYNGTALYFLVKNSNNYPAIKTLLEAGADPNIFYKKEEIEQNLMPIIGYSKSLLVYKLLLEHGAYVRSDLAKTNQYSFEDEDILVYTGYRANQNKILDSYANVKTEGLNSTGVRRDGRLETGKFVYFETTQPAMIVGQKAAKYLDYKKVETTEPMSRKDIIDKLVRPKETMRRATFFPISQILIPCKGDCSEEIKEQEEFFKELNK